MRCRGLHGLANLAYLSGFPFSGLPSIAAYCARGGVRVVSTWRARRGAAALLFVVVGVPEQGYDSIRVIEKGGGAGRSVEEKEPSYTLRVNSSANWHCNRGYRTPCEGVNPKFVK